jgi:Uma2 family endonuclease
MSAVMDVVGVGKEYEILAKDAGETPSLSEEKNMTGARHSGVGTRLIIKLGRYLEENNVGAVYGPDATYKLPTKDRLPDVSFIAAARIPEAGEPIGSWELAPDLAVEVISPMTFTIRSSAKSRNILRLACSRFGSSPQSTRP